MVLNFSRATPLWCVSWGGVDLRHCPRRWRDAPASAARAPFLVQYSMVQRVACVYQANTFGQQGYTSLVAALANVGGRLARPPAQQSWAAPKFCSRQVRKKDGQELLFFSTAFKDLFIFIWIL